MMARIFVTGGTGYVGRRLVRALWNWGMKCVCWRAESVNRIPAGAVAVVGDALDASSFMHELREGGTLVHLVRLDQMVSALVRAVEQPPAPGTVALVDVQGIKAVIRSMCT